MGLPQMSGNYHASQYLAPYDAATGRGYATHAVTTGISAKLYVTRLMQLTRGACRLMHLVFACIFFEIMSQYGS